MSSRISFFGRRQNRVTLDFAPKIVATGVTPVAFDLGTIGGSGTFAHSCSGTNRYLVVQIALGTGTDTISGVTYFGVAMTQLFKQSGTFGVELWGLVNPASGSHNVVITRGTGAGAWATGATSFTNVDQTTPVKAGSGTGASGSGITSFTGPSQTTNTGGMIVEGFAENAVTPTGSTQTGWYDGSGDGGYYLLGTGSAQTTTYTIGVGSYAMASVVLNAVGQTGAAGTAYTDADTPVVAITPSSTDIKAVDYADSTTTPILITASATELHEITDANTPRVTITPSSTDLKAVDYADSGTPVVAITPSVVDVHEIPDANTAALKITPSSTDLKAIDYADSGTVPLALTPSVVDVHEIPDANTAVVAITPSSTDLKAVDYLESGTPRVTLTPSAVEVGIEHTDAATVSVAITPSSSEVYAGAAAYTDAATPVVAITPSTVEARVSTDANTATLTITPSSAIAEQYADAATVLVEIRAGTPLMTRPGLMTQPGLVTGSQPSDTAQFVDVSTVGVVITPSGVDVKTTGNQDAATVSLVITPGVSGAGNITNRTAVVTQSASTQSITATVPSSVAIDDVLVLWLTLPGTSVGQLTPPSGWTQFVAPAVVNTNLVAGYYYVVTNPASIPAATASTSAAAGRATAIMQAYVGAKTTGPIDVAAVYSTTTGTSIALTGLTTITDNDRVITGVFGDFATGTWTVPGGTTLVGTHTSGTGKALAVADVTKTPPGATGTLTWSDTAASLALAGFVAALAPAAGAGEIAQFVDAATPVVAITPSSTEIYGRTLVDTVTVPVALTPSASEGAVFVDSATTPVAITPSGVDVLPNADVGTVPIAFTPSAVEAAQFGDAVTLPFAITPSTVEARISTDSATVPVAFTPSAAEGAQFADSANVPLLLTPASVEATVFADAVSVGVALTPTSTDTAQYLESATIPVALTPSAAEVYGRVLTDTGTVALTLSPSAQESAQRADASTVPVALTCSGSEFVIAGLFDADTAYVHVTPSIVEIAALIDSATVPMKLTVTGVDVPERAFLDSNTVPITMTPTTTFEDLFKTDVAEVYVGIVPYALSEFQGDGDIVPVHITAALVEIFVHEDANVVILNIDNSSLEVTSLTTMSLVRFTITPAITELIEAVEAATILVSITPGVVFELQQVADYLLIGVISNKWTAILRDNTYSGTLHDTRYVVVGFDNRWSYHYRGRGDE